MATLYKNTGKARASILTIDRRVDNSSITGYPKIYNLKSSYPGLGLSELSNADFRKLTEDQYIARRDAIISYAKSDTGYTASVSEIAVGSISTNTVACPIDGYVTP